MTTGVIQKDSALNNWQIEETKKGLGEADRGDFASERDVQEILRRWTQPAD